MSILSEKIKNLKDGESFNFNYKDKKYEFCCYSYSDEKNIIQFVMQVVF